MTKLAPALAALVVGLVVGALVGVPGARAPEAAAPPPGTGFASIPGEKGGQDLFGPYEVVPDWPKPMSQLAGHDKWTWGSAEGVFAESPNRIFLVQRGELPVVQRPQSKLLPEFGPSIVFPVALGPFRNATTASPGAAEFPGAGLDPGQKLGVDARWEHNFVVVNGAGDIIEDDVWKRYDAMWRRPHSVFMSPYDAEKHIWVVDDTGHAIYKFSNDGKQIVQTLGTPYQPGDDDKHFNRPTFLAWAPDGSLYVSDGYTNTRVAKFDKDGTFVKAWGQKGTPPNDTRPGYFNTVHGIGVDPATGRVFVNDRNNRRVQVFDADGTFLDQFSYGQAPTSDAHTIYLAGDRHLWVVDRTSAKMVKYDLDGHFLYSWGVGGEFPGAFWGVHGVSVDQDNNLYVAEVNAGRFQKYRPRPGANPDFLIGQPVRAAWK